MKNQIKVLEALNNALQTKSNGTSLLEKLDNVYTCYSQTAHNVEYFIENRLNPILEKHMPLGVCLETTFDFEFMHTVDYVVYRVNIDEIGSQNIDRINPQIFYTQEESTQPHESTFKLSIYFEIKDHPSQSPNDNYLFTATHFIDNDLNGFMSKIDNLSFDRLIQELSLEDFLDKSILEENIKSIIDQFSSKV